MSNNCTILVELFVLPKEHIILETTIYASYAKPYYKTPRSPVRQRRSRTIDDNVPRVPHLMENNLNRTRYTKQATWEA
ncbi:hypothetical protein BDA96_10G146100 [Sorghum bicolor]|jgi:hypothetical protein|uniref:Uncharacterized protein n=1 Tax=Sorghum bicolor TaxID=4558 RepID=A0A921Q572_SORBI|nr:hypothetical protein BDA96_10G146100 [Sorghum bicolor]